MTRLERTIVAGAVLVAGGALLGRAAETAEAVLARFIEATGGRAAYEMLRNRVVHATMEISRQGINGKPCHKLVLTPKTGRPVTLLFDEATSLLVRTDMIMATEAGEIPVQIWLQDYREVDGLKLAYRTAMQLLGQERVMTINRHEQNVDLPADRFALPAGVKALLPARQ